MGHAESHEATIAMSHNNGLLNTEALHHEPHALSLEKLGSLLIGGGGLTEEEQIRQEEGETFGERSNLVFPSHSAIGTEAMKEQEGRFLV